jgi:pilus assembly protein CpaF
VTTARGRAGRDDATARAAPSVDHVRDRLVRDLPALAALHLAGQQGALAALVHGWAAAGGASAEDAAGIAADLAGCGPLETLLADERVSEIMVNGLASVHVEVNGRLLATEVRFRDAHHLRAVIDRLVAAAGRRLDESTPTVDAVLPDGSRLNAVLPPVAVDGPLLTIRRSRPSRLDLPDLVRSGSLPPAVAAFLHAAVIGRCNLLISGGAGAGKTTLLAALARLVPADQRIVTIEDVAELRIDHPHVASQQCRDAVTATAGTVDMRALVRNTLRMRPDRILVGEVRGPEAADMVSAMNTGHPGSMSTVHANSAADALSRIEAMIGLAWPGLSGVTLRSWIVRAVDVVVHCERDAEGRRLVAEVVALDDRSTTVMYRLEGADAPTSIPRPPQRCLERMSRYGVDFAPELLLRRHVA